MKSIEARTCVDAWVQVCEYLLEQKDDAWRAYNIILEIANPLALPPPDRAAFDVLDSFLRKHGGLPINTVVNTIFPAQLYVRHGAAGVYERYISEVYPQVKKHPDCSWGTYAHRLLCRTDADGSTLIPLKDLVEKLKIQLTLNGPNRAVYELGIVDPLLDIPIYEPRQDRTRPIGGPCLTHVSIKLMPDRRLMLTGFYRSHYYVQRALGNLFGLAHLQHFIAEQTGLELGPLVCHSSMAQLELKPKTRGHLDNERWGKGEVCNLIEQCVAARRIEAA